MRTLNSPYVRPVVPFCTGFSWSVQARRANVRPHRAGLRHGPAAMTVRCRELSPLADAPIPAIGGRRAAVKPWLQGLAHRPHGIYPAPPRFTATWHAAFLRWQSGAAKKDSSHRRRNCKNEDAHFYNPAVSSFRLYGRSCRSAKLQLQSLYYETWYWPA
jgi:hypothetical protein